MSWWRKLFGWEGEGEEGSERAGREQHPPARTPAEELEIARRALEVEGNPQHAVHHLAEALADDPTDPERLRLLDEVLAAAGGDPDELIGENDRGYYACEAVRAFALQRQGRTAEALDLLIAIARAKPDAPYLEAWAVEWLEDDATLKTLDAQTLELLAGILAVQAPEHRELRSRPRQTLQRLAAALDRYRADFLVGAPFRMWRTVVLRKLGLFEEAVAEARQLHQEHPEWQTAVAVANAYRRRGDVDEAVRWFQQALKHDPHDLAVRNDIADFYVELEDWPNALRWYEEVVQQQKDHPWALPSLYFCRWMITRDDQWTSRLAKLTEGPEPNQRAEGLLDAFRPYRGYLPEPADASANVLRQVAEAIEQNPQEAPAGEVKLTVSCLESPSNLLAFDLQMQALGAACKLKVIAESLPKPDPRKPLSPVEYLLWEYEGNDARPALPAPSEEIARLVAGLAARPYHFWTSWNEAGVAAERLDSERVDELLAVMVHPPAIQGQVSALVWVPRVQLAAAQIIAQIDAGWHGSLRRRVLLDVARGPRDWTTDAAIIALAQLAISERQPAITAEVRQVFQQLLDARPSHGHCQYLHPLLTNWLYLPELPERERKQITKRLRELHAS